MQLFSCRGSRIGIHTSRNVMTATLDFDPERFRPATLQLILRRAQEWQCTPAEAVARLLDEVAAKAQAGTKKAG